MAASGMNLCILICLCVVFFIIYFTKVDSYNKYNQSIIVLYRQCARWASASLQDKSELVQVLHANYAAGYLWALKDIVSTEYFYKLTGQNFLAFEHSIVDIQNKATKRLINKCKDLIFIDDPTLFNAMYI